MKIPQLIHVEHDESRLTVKLTNPPQNLITKQMIQQISTVVEKMRGDESLKLVIFSSGVSEVFSRGFDFQELAPENVGGIVAAFGHLLSLLNALEVITVVEVDGVCFGGGMELAAYCDMIIASERSKFGHPEVEYGMFPPVAAALYSHLIGRNRCIELLVTGREIDAREAHKIGLIARFWKDAEFSLQVEDFYRTILQNSAVTLKLTKKAIEKSLYERVSTAISATENIYLNELLPSHDAREGIRARLELRKPIWINK